MDRRRRPVVVRPWGKVEGFVRAGKTPLPDQTIVLDSSGSAGIVPTTNPARPYQFTGGGAGQFVRLAQTTRTDSAGHYVFARVPPGGATVTQQGESRDGGPMFAQGMRSTSVQVAAGQTVQADLGGAGRAIAGQAKAEVGGPIPAGLLGSVQANTAQAGLKVGPDWATKSEAERTRIVEEWYQSVRQSGIRAPLAVEPDGSFRADDLPPGDYFLQLGSYSFDGGVGEITAEGSTTFKVPAPAATADGGAAEAPIDVGFVTVRERPHLTVGAAAPPLKAVKPDGSAVQLADYHGRYVLLSLVQQYEGSGNALGQEMVMGGSLVDRIGGSKLVKLAIFIPWGGAANTQPAASAAPTGWVVALCNDRKSLDPRYASSPGTYLVDPDGSIVGKQVGRSYDAYRQVDQSLGIMADHAEGVEVVTEKLVVDAGGPPDAPAFAFKTIPTLSADDAGQRATFAIVDGRKAGFGGDLSVLNDGRAPRHDTDEPLMLTFDPGVLEGRISADLGKAVDVTQVNTYARYKDSHRWTQVYRVYGSDGGGGSVGSAGTTFDPAPKIGTDPTTVGWTFIADVDTRTTPGGTNLHDNDRAQAGASVRKKDGSALGKYRYLLFQIFADETMNAYGQTFWSEIDIVGK